ncbi:hypothetical protein [Dethiothermospora halolimnae]|uniref:hypothetical protein n=1 Tax=Dethiothermospora halolimnae TaxID=3114390 RepID=UPI003CCBB312
MINIDNTTEEELKNLTKEKLKNYILNINDKQLTRIGILSLLEMIQSIIDVKDGLEEGKELLEDRLSEEYDDIINLYKDIEIIGKDIFNILKDQGDNKIEEKHVFELREKAHKLLLGMSGYITEIAYINEIANGVLEKEKFNKSYNNMVQNIDLKKFYDNVYKFLTEDMNTLHIKAMEIVRVVPMKIAKQKYYDIIKTAIKKSLGNSSETKTDRLIKRYKSIFNGTMEIEYGQGFDFYFRKTHEFKQFDFKTASIDEVEKVYNDTTKILVEMNDITEMIREIGLIINRIIIILFSIDKISNKKEQVINIIEIYNDDKRQRELSKLLKEGFKEVNEEFTKDNINLEKIIGVYIDKDRNIDEDINKELMVTKEYLAYLNDNYLEDIDLLIDKEGEIATQDYLEQSVDNLTQYINRNIKGMSNKQRKVRMRRLLYLTDFPFEKPEDFFNYLKNSIENNSSKDDIILSINKVASVMASYKSKK